MALEPYGAHIKSITLRGDKGTRWPMALRSWSDLYVGEESYVPKAIGCIFVRNINVRFFVGTLGLWGCLYNMEDPYGHQDIGCLGCP